MGDVSASRTPEAALVLPSFASGGAERVVLNLAVGLAGRGWTVRLLTLDGQGPMREQVPPAVEVVTLGHPRARRAGPAIVAELRRRPADMLVGSQTHLNVLLGLVRPLLPRTTRLVLREPSLQPDANARSRKDLAIGRVLGRADVVVASSSAMHEHLVASVRGRARTVLLPNPVDVDGLRALAASGTPERSRAGSAHLVSVGRLIGLKAHDDLLRALARSGTGHTLTLVGDGPERVRLERLTAELGLAGRVEFTGRVDDPARLAALVAEGDVLVHPSRWEGLPNAVLEALALGTPVLATTDLAVLATLAEEVGPDALRLVPRDGLPDALRGVRVRTVTGSTDTLRPNLLPARFRLPYVVDALLDAADAAGGR